VQIAFRFLGADTPETVHPSRPVECFGKQASDYVRSKLIGHRVQLEFDPRSDRVDRYGRPLVLVTYFTLEGSPVLLNLELIERGLARSTAFRHTRRAQFAAAQAKAKADLVGGWAPAPAGCAWIR